MQRGSGWANWDTFAEAAEPVLEEMYRRLGRNPRDYELSAAGHQWLISAARSHHQGYLAVLKKLGRERAPLARKIPGPQTSPLPDWSIPQNRMAVLETFCDEWLSWGIFPSTTALKESFESLMLYFLRQDHWKNIALLHGYLPPVQGRMQKRTALLVIKILDFYELNQRWPSQLEIGVVIARRRNFSRGNRWRLLQQTEYHPLVIERLVQRWTQHVHWIEKHQPQLEPERRQVLNGLIVARNIGCTQIPVSANG